MKNSPQQREAGTPAFQEYLEKSGRGREFEGARTRLRQRADEIESKLESRTEAALEIRRGIEGLACTYAEQDKLFHVIALHLALQERRQQRGHWIKEMRRHKRSMKGVAGQIRQVASEAEEVCGCPQSHPDLYEIALQKPHGGPVIPESKRAPRAWIAQARALADDLEANARRLGWLAKAEGPRLKRQSLLQLAQLTLATVDGKNISPDDIMSQVMRRLEILATIIQTAYRQFGITAEAPTADALRLMLERHELPSKRR